MSVCSPDASGVVVELVLIFEFASNDNRKAFSERIKSILLRRLQTNTGGLEIDLSTFKLSGKFLELSLFSLILLLRPSLSSVQCDLFYSTDVSPCCFLLPSSQNSPVTLIS